MAARRNKSAGLRGDRRSFRTRKCNGLTIKKKRKKSKCRLMPEDVVVVLAYWRPDYIGKCLDSLLSCPEIQNTQVAVFQDSRVNLPENRASLFSSTTKIVKSYAEKFSRFHFMERPAHDFDMTGSGQFHPSAVNAQSALLSAYDSGAEYIYYVQDDVLVTPDFLRWHKAVQEDGDYFSTCSDRLPTDWDSKPFDLGAYYQSPIRLDNGLCWRRANLEIALNLPSRELIDFRFPEREQMIPFVQRSYHVGKRSAAAYQEEFCECGDVDEIPTETPNYEWNKVYLVR